MPTASFGTALLLARFFERMQHREQQIRTMELRRLHELELQAAQYGPHTDPGVLIEIQELYTKYPEVRRARSAIDHERLDFDFLMNAVAAALQRLTALEDKYRQDARRRYTRQAIHDVWMVVITTLAFLNLLLLLWR